MYLSRRNYGICLLALVLALALVGAGWAQTASPTAPDANPYRQAVALLDQAEQQLTAGNLSSAMSLAKQTNAIFTRLRKESAAKLAERELSSQESQQLAINQKLAVEAQAQADGLLETAAAKEKQARELKAQGQAEAADVAYREAKEQYRQVQNLSIKSLIYALRNQQKILEFANAVYLLTTPQERQKDLDDCLRVVRGTPIKVILSGATAGEFIYREPAESTPNDILIEWKNKKLPELLQMATSAQLSDLAINLEKGIFNLDLEAKKLKNLADEDARQATAPGQTAPAKMAPAGALTIAHLLEQRKTTLLAILGPVRQAAAQRAAAGG